VVGTFFVLGSGKIVRGSNRAAPSKATGRGAKKVTKGSKKGQKWCPRWVIVATSSNNNDDKEVDGADEEYVMAAEHDSKHQV
jgi:hypothetical protein